ncbi:hypothetical protein [Rubellimicrobium roseum]|uniref:Uncharacterized protein n=1 Tax=Rubellimicrobium roseum TaxID=687525 RepID=A0A5C4N3F6_9RHOB|nr:hypothetical protein [Rubellimicrobium roseum]TNC60057.1 hypothetical protein FHG71_22290 [Rubellimicrobium roseum]
MTLYLHNPASEAHLEDLKDRLVLQLAGPPRDVRSDREDLALADHLVEVVRAMDHGRITTREALETFTRHRVPGFSFGRWLVEMVDEGVYLDAVYDEAA